MGVGAIVVAVCRLFLSNFNHFVSFGFRANHNIIRHDGNWSGCRSINFVTSCDSWYVSNGKVLALTVHNFIVFWAIFVILWFLARLASLSNISNWFIAVQNAWRQLLTFGEAVWTSFALFTIPTRKSLVYGGDCKIHEICKICAKSIGPCDLSSISVGDSKHLIFCWSLSPQVVYSWFVSN